MKFRVLSPISQGIRLETGGVHDRQLIKGDTIDVNDKEAAELIAAGAIDPDPIDQGTSTDSSDMSGANQSYLADALANPGAGTSAPSDSENTGAEQSNPADASIAAGTDASAPPAVTGAKKAGTKAAK